MNLLIPQHNGSHGSKNGSDRNGQRVRGAFFGIEGAIRMMYGRGRKERVSDLLWLYPHVVNQENFHEHADALDDLEVIFTTWGMPCLNAEQLNKMPRLRSVYYAGGTVQGFARPLLERNITVVSAWQANAIPVAEFTLSQILLAAKGYFRNTAEYKKPEVRNYGFQGKGCFGESVALLGAGAIGSRVIRFLQPFSLKIVVYDPFLSEETASQLRVEKVSLEEAFERGYVVSNHLANCPPTKRILNRSLFQRMRKDATFINTGRGATVNEADLIEVFQARPDLTALLDVTCPEPPVEDSPLFRLPNVHLSTHIAGSIGDEVVRMADYCIDEFLACEANEPLRYAVSMEMLETMA